MTTTQRAKYNGWAREQTINNREWKNEAAILEAVAAYAEGHPLGHLLDEGWFVGLVDRYLTTNVGGRREVAYKATQIAAAISAADAECGTTV